MRPGMKLFNICMLIVIAVLFGTGMIGMTVQSPEAAMAFMPFALGTVGIAGSSRVVTNSAKIIDWEKGMKKYAGKDPKDIKSKIIEAFDKYIRKQARQPVRGEKIRGADPNLQATIPIVEVISDPNAVAEPDRGYELIFREVNMRGTRTKTFKVLDVSGGITYYQQDVGQEAKMSRLPNTSMTAVEMLRFTGGLSILDDWITYNEFYLIDQLMEDTSISWWDKKATLFYGMMIALDSSINIAFDTDISTTINKACASILNSMKTKKARNMGAKRFVLTCRETDRFKIAKALAASFANANTNINEIVYNIQAVVPTTYLPSDAAYFYISLPGIKNMRGEWEDFNARPAQRNEIILGSDQVFTGAYNGIIGEVAQHRRCPLS